MKGLILTTLFFLSLLSSAQKTENIIIITTDGFRWQEVFKGLDTEIANNKDFNKDSREYIFKKYGSSDFKESRQKIMPFLWTEIAAKGQIYGNRVFENKVDVLNSYSTSFPGYSEIMIGHADSKINSNNYKENPNGNVLEFLNKQPKLTGKVAAFGAWKAFDRILNEKRSGLPVISAFDPVGGSNPTAIENLLNKMRDDSFKPFHEDECLDVFTHYQAWNELTTKKPKVLYIAYGETDAWADSGNYKSYLDAANQVDAWLKQIWEFVQNDSQYKNKTTILLTVDHGRGDKKKKNWKNHGRKVEESSQIWFAIMGPEISPKGEVKTETQLYQKQFAQTIAKLMGYTFTAEHPVANEIKEIFEN